eukprot:g9778.t1
MVSTRGKKTGTGNQPPSPPEAEEAAPLPKNINNTQDRTIKEEPVGQPPPDNQPTAETGETEATEVNDVDLPDGKPVSAGAMRQDQSESPVSITGGAAGDAQVPKTKEAEEGKEASQETIESRPGGDEKSDGRPPAAEPAGGADDAMDVAEVQTEVGDVDSSSDEEDEDDGFKVVVGREVAPAPAPTVPAKRFLRGTNTLVNTATSGTATSKEPGSNAASSKPASAAAGIASLVPSKGAPVATGKPSLKPGEYPPTAELQQSSGKTAFDVDIDGMEEQPWRHPGVDIADFFNYGFTEDSWRVYCEKQLRNRYDRSRGRSKLTPNSTGSRGGGSTGGSSSHTRHGGGDRPNSLQLPRPPPPSQMHNNNGPPGPNSFRPLRPAGDNGGAWGGGGGGGGPERFPPGGFGSGPPGRGNVSPPWFEGKPPSQQMHMQMQMQQQIHPQNRQHFGPGPGPGGGAMRGPGANMNGGMVDPAGMRRSRSPDPRDRPVENKMPRLR